MQQKARDVKQARKKALLFLNASFILSFTKPRSAFDTK
jgi:hypothetical protein